MKRTLSLLVVLAMLLGMVGVTALTLGEEPTQVDIVFLVNDEKYERKAILGEKAKAPQIDVPAGYCLRWDPEDLIVRKADQEFVGVFVAAEAPAPAPVTEPEPAPAPAEQPKAPAEEPEVTGEEPEAPADEPEVTAEQPEAPADEPEAPADEPEVTAEQPEAPAEEPEAPAEQPEAPAEQPEAPADEPEVTAEGPAAPAEEPKAPAEEPVAPAPVTEPEPEPAAPAETPAAPAEEPEAPAEEPEVTLAEVMNRQPAEEHEQAAPKTKQPVGETVTVTTATDVRQAADGLSPIFATVAAGTVLPVLGREGDWLKVEAEGQIGFIYQPVQPDPEQPKEYAPKKVTIFTSRRMQMTLGEPIHLTSILEGFEDCEAIKYQWECDKGNGFMPVPDANSDSYSFAASVETIGWSWKLTVFFR